MDAVKFRAWVYHLQGLSERTNCSPREALLTSGWQRSVGGVSPYIAIHARCGASREQIDADSAALQLYELPSARGCTYVLPCDDFRVGLSAATKFGSAAGVATGRKLGVSDEEIETLKLAALVTLKSGSQSPAELKTKLDESCLQPGVNPEREEV